MYEGSWSLSMKQGEGVETFKNGDMYKGSYFADKFQGYGELKTGSCLYKGQFKDGKKNGVGTASFTNGCKYEGHWENGRFHGHGLHLWSDGRRFEGNWVNGERCGQGVLTLPNGEKYDGLWLANKKHGTGWWRLSNGKVRQGEWKNDEFVKWTGPEQFETQLKLQRTLEKQQKSATNKK